MKFLAIGMADAFRESLRKQGYEEINPNRFIILGDDGRRAIWEYTGDSWVLSVGMICGVEVLDEES